MLKSGQDNNSKGDFSMNGFDICKANWKKMLVGTPELLQNADKTIKERIKACSDRAMTAWKEFDSAFKVENPVGFFRTERAVTSGDMTRDYARLTHMALGYATFGTECYQNETLLNDILDALEWGYKNYYGKAEMENKGWRDVRQFNWWDWCIGTPSNLMQTMILVDGHLTLEQKKNYLALFGQRVPVPRDYGSNKVHFGELIAESAILCENAERVFVGRDGIEDTYLYADGGVNDGQGFYRDGSYIFHTLHPMNFTYGVGHFSGIIDFAAILVGSEFELKKEHTDLLYTWLYKTYVPFCRNGEIFRSVLGRHPAGTRSGACGFVKNVVRLYGLSADDKKAELSDLITMLTDEHPLSKDGYNREIFGSLSLNDYLLFKQAYKGGGAKIKRNGLYAFNCMDRAVQHTDDYAFSLSISSCRIYNYECINHENMNGWYHGDGMLNLITTPFKYGPDYWKNVDPYRIPGTTADDGERELVSIAQANEYLSSKDFVGTLSAGDTGVSVMQLESYHGDGQLISTRFYNPSGAYGSAPPARECTLTANKAYFFMKDYAVCLGSAITAHDGRRVYTVIENRHGVPVIENLRVVSHSAPAVTVNGEKADLPSIDTVYNAKSFTIDSDAYCVLDGAPVIMKQTEGELPFVQAVIDHGTDPENGSYAYAVLPFTGATEAAKFASDAPIEIIENSPSVQAIREKASGDIYCVFHKVGSVSDISVEAPLLVSVKGGVLYACDVTQKLGATEITVYGKKYVFDFTGALGKASSLKL